MIFAFLIYSINLFAKEIVVEPGEGAHERLQEALILMSEGDTLLIKAGYYNFEDGLSLDVDDVMTNGPIIGQEYLSLRLTTPDLDGQELDFTNTTFCIYKISAKVKGSNKRKCTRSIHVRLTQMHKFNLIPFLYQRIFLR